MHRIRFEVDTGRMSTGIDDPALRNLLNSSRVDVDVWLDDKTSLPHSMTLALEGRDGTGVLLRARFSDYDAPVTIVPPQ